MIDSSLHAPLLPLLLFHLRQLFWLDLWPVVLGFVTIFCFQIYSRVGLMGARNKLLVFVLSAAASALSLFGWAAIVRSTRTIPLCACGVGLANLLASQIHALTMPRHPRLRIRLPKVVWRGDQDTVRKYKEQLDAARMPAK
jgi:hypothetical protein